MDIAMSDFPLVVILLLTHDRTEYALRTIKQTMQSIYYPNLKWYVANSSDNTSHYGILRKQFDALYKGHTGIMSPGKSWNMGIKEIYKDADVYLRLEDDWVPRGYLDIHEMVKLLWMREDIGMIRLGYLHVPADLEAFTVDGTHYLRYKKTTQFAYGGHPALIHRRFHDAYGLNDESLSPGEIETHMDAKVRSTEGPSIIRPAKIGGWGAFTHIGEKQA